jgi:lipoyl(octanoyl) transferase
MMTSSHDHNDWDIAIQWNCPFENYLKTLHDNTQILLQEKEKKILLIQSHPHCFTKGRGLRQKSDGPSLIDVSPDVEKNLPYPLYSISRGGGLTFHYPGQVIIYPMVNLNTFPKALMTLMHLLLLTTGETLKDLNYIKDFHLPKESYGLWSGNRKIASIGMGLDHYITQHGLALNFFHDTEMFSTIQNLHPCGISANTYTNLESLNQTSYTLEDREQFLRLFIQKFLQKLKR